VSLRIMAPEETIWQLIARAVSGEISPEEVEELEAIFIANPEYRTDYENIKSLSLDHEHLPVIDERRALERGLEKFDNNFANNNIADRLLFQTRLEPLKVRNFRKWYASAAIVAFFMVSPIIFYKLHSKTGQISSEVLVTHYGQRKKATLPDGSVVWLNAGSSIEYIQNGKREVLLSGEAYFDVKHDAAHPFVVHAGKLNVVVLGTAFNIKAYKTEPYIETTLIRGKVEILNTVRPGVAIVLLPNQKVRVNMQTNADKKTVLLNKLSVKDSTADITDKKQFVAAVPDSSIVETAWVNNKLSFKNEDFESLTRQLDRWYAVTIMFDNNKYAGKHFTGTFKNQNIDEVMQALQLTESFHYSINNDQIHIW
jgi:transmembrane sensor